MSLVGSRQSQRMPEEKVQLHKSIGPQEVWAAFYVCMKVSIVFPWSVLIPLSLIRKTLSYRKGWVIQGCRCNSQEWALALVFSIAYTTCVGACLSSQHLGDGGRRIRSPRLSSATSQIPGHPGLCATWDSKTKLSKQTKNSVNHFCTVGERVQQWCVWMSLRGGSGPAARCRLLPPILFCLCHPLYLFHLLSHSIAVCVIVRGWVLQKEFWIWILTIVCLNFM